MTLFPIESVARKDAALRLEELEHIFGQLRALSREKGYRRAWANVAFFELTGVWPGHAGVSRFALHAPSVEIREWESRRWSGFVATLHGAPPPGAT